MKMFSPRRQHPSAIFFTFLRNLREMIFPIIVLLVTSLGGGGAANRYTWVLGIGSIIVVLIILGSILYWLRFTYYVQDGELRIEKGIFIRNKRYMPQERIQTINVSSGILQRLFGVVKVEVDTAGGGGKADVQLSAVTISEAETLRASLTHNKQRQNEADIEMDHSTTEPTAPQSVNGTQVQHRLPVKDLFIAASTSGSFGIVFSLIFAGISQLNQLLPNIDLFYMATQFVEANWGLFLIVVPAIALISWVIALLNTMLKYASFTLTKNKQEIHITRGLFEKREFTIPLKRIQAIRVVEGILRQPFGFVTVFVESAGYGTEGGESVILYPLLRRKQLVPFLQEIAPEFVLEQTWQTLPKRSMKRYIIRSVVPTMIIVAPVSLYVPYGWLSLIMIPLSFVLGLLRYHDAGFYTEEKKIALRFRRLSRTTLFIPKRRIQSAHTNRSWFQRRRDLSTYTVMIVSNVFGVMYSIKDLEQDDGQRLFDWATPYQDYPN